MSAKHKLNSSYLTWILGAALVAGALTGSIAGFVITFIGLFALCYANGDIRA
jgi:hypothetical protein